jgi:hypothetical protein
MRCEPSWCLCVSAGAPSQTDNVYHAYANKPHCAIQPHAHPKVTNHPTQNNAKQPGKTDLEVLAVVLTRELERRALPHLVAVALRQRCVCFRFDGWEECVKILAGVSVLWFVGGVKRKPGVSVLWFVVDG